MVGKKNSVDVFTSKRSEERKHVRGKEIGGGFPSCKNVLVLVGVGGAHCECYGFVG